MKAAVVRAADAGRAGAQSLLEDAVDRAGLWRLLAERADGEPEELRVVLAVAELPCSGRDTPVGPVLMERFVFLLRERGFHNVVVITCGHDNVRTRDVSPDVDDDVSDGLVREGLPVGSVLRSKGVARNWVEAEFRVNIAGNATHPEWGYAACLAGLLHVLPPPDSDHCGAWMPGDEPEAVVDLLRYCPPDFNILSIPESSDSSVGARPAGAPVNGAVVATSDAVLADVIAASLIGVDPAVSPLAAQALTQIGLPGAYDIEGDLTPFPDWRNPPRMLPDMRAALCGLLSTAGIAKTLTRSLQMSLAKGALPRRRTSLGLDLDAYRTADYDDAAAGMDRLEPFIGAVPPRPDRMRWRYLDGAVLFGCERTVDVPYDAFVTRVDISRVIALTSDYLGGCVVPVDRDNDGQVIRQAERSVNLPQPNYLAFFGADVLDVCKLESVSRTADGHRLAWRAVRSPNESAIRDDGSVAFLRADGGHRTRVVIRTYQQFALPPCWQVVKLEAVWPGLRDALVGDAYHRFFRRTLDNIEAGYAGRDVRIGRSGEEGEGVGLLTGWPDVLTRLAGEIAQQAACAMQPLSRSAGPEHVDADGFRHFAAAESAPEGLLEALAWLPPRLPGLLRAVFR